jgi:hypothetical protein
MEPYRSNARYTGLLLPETEKLVQRVMTLPTGTTVSETDIATIGHLVRFAIMHSQQILEKMS